MSEGPRAGPGVGAGAAVEAGEGGREVVRDGGGGGVLGRRVPPAGLPVSRRV